jgi:hypothetical protein
VLAAIGVAFALQSFTSSADADAYRVQVTRDGRSLASYTLDELEAMPQRSVRMQDKAEKGPSLLTVLERAGVAEFASVAISGEGVRDDGQIELARDLVDDDVLLDIAGRGTTKLCGPDIDQGDWVRDVSMLAVTTAP